MTGLSLSYTRSVLFFPIFTLLLLALFLQIHKHLICYSPESNICLFQLKSGLGKAIIYALKQQEHNRKSCNPPDCFYNNHEREGKRVTKG